LGKSFNTLIAAGNDQNRLGFAASSMVSGFTLTSTSADPTVRELGFQANQTASVPAGSSAPQIVAVKDAPPVVGQLSADTTFNLSLAGGPAIPVTVYADDTANNTTIINLVTDINQALRVPAIKSGKLTNFKPTSPITFTVRVNGGTVNTVTVPV